MYPQPRAPSAQPRGTRIPLPTQRRTRSQGTVEHVALPLMRGSSRAPQHSQDDIPFTRMVAESQAQIENLWNEQSRNEPPIDPPSQITPFHSTMSAQPPATETPDREVEHSYLTPVARVLQVQPMSGQTPPPIQGASLPFRLQFKELHRPSEAPILRLAGHGTPQPRHHRFSLSHISLVLQLPQNPRDPSKASDGRLLLICPIFGLYRTPTFQKF